MNAGSGTEVGPRRLRMRELELATGVGRETIRFYIREGLLPQPERPARNVALYDESFVERIRLINELKTKRYLPLHVIRRILEESEGPNAPEVTSLLALDGKIFPALESTSAPAAEPIETVAQRIGLPVGEIHELAGVGAITLEERGETPCLDADATALVEVWAELRRSGFTAERGFTPSQTRLYVDALDNLAEEELHLFAHGISAGVDAEEGARMARMGIELLNKAIGLVRKRKLLERIATGNLPDEAD